ncbi:MAG: ATP-binding protein [Desulfovibrio sp.]|jgi:hypothetical protein|nr:ATP-binding protein [Desulfovibrio sp.]
MTELRKLPIGYQTFEDVRTDGAIYVDKTGYLPGLENNGKVVFCARPRRFGKSLTVSALDAFHSGRKDLFGGLTAGAALDSPAFRPRPVVRLDMSAVTPELGLDVMLARLRDILASNAERHGLAMPDGDPVAAFVKLIASVRKAKGEKAVLLVDEYDAPVIDSLGKPEVDAVREIMRSFYKQIKVVNEHLHFAFITGVSKFTRMGVFSSLNNITDISLEPEYAAFMGITHEELAANFGPHIGAAAGKLGMTPDDLLEKIRDYYDGFSFDGKTRLYNPFSTLLFLQKAEFLNYWMESGSNTVIRNFLKDKKLTVDEFRGMPVSRASLFDPGPIESATPELFLYQAGYLSLRQNENGIFSLDYPNFETLSSFSSFMVRNTFRNDTAADSSMTLFLNAFLNRDAEGMIAEIKRNYAAQSYQDHDASEKKGYGEDFYRSSLLSYLHGAGVMAVPELQGSHGRADIAAWRDGRTMIIELKMADSPADAEKAADDGMAQIRDRDYGGRFVSPLLLSIAIDKSARQVAAWKARRVPPAQHAGDDEDRGPNP